MFKYKSEHERLFNHAEIYYDERYKQDIQNNVNILRSEINTPEVELKITNWQEKWGDSTPLKDIKQKILSDQQFAYGFVKDPTRQTCYQHYAEDYLKLNILTINKQVQTLPAGGPNAKYIYKGEVVCGQDEFVKATGNKSGEVKSIDFEIDITDVHGVSRKFYVSHKHTTKQGGTQDNQWKDLQDFMKQAMEANIPNTYFIALADGDYYNRVMNKEGCTRMEYLNKFSSESVMALNIVDFCSKLNELSGN